MQLPRVVDAADPGADAAISALLQLLVDGTEEVVLVGEVVVQRAAGDTRPGHDLLGAHGRVAALGEQLAAGAQEGDASRGAARRAASGSRIQSVCYSPYNLYVTGARHDLRRLALARPRPGAETLDLGGGRRIRAHVTGEGPPIVFVHGVLVNANLWRKVVPRLDGFTRVALDLPLGSHLEPMPKNADLTPPALADLIADALDGARASTT